MSAKGSLFEELTQWGIGHNSYLNPNVEIYEDPITGLSFKALKDLPPETKISTCSYETSLSYLNAVEFPGFLRHSPPFPPGFLSLLCKDDPNIIGFFFLIQQYLMREKSFWWPYIRLLPQPGNTKDLPVPCMWPEEDVKFLEGTNAEPPIRKRNKMWKAEWEGAVSLLRANVKDWEDYTYKLYQWAATIFGSRSFRASLTIAEQMVDNDPLIQMHVRKDHFSVLLPILDIGNHNGVNNADWHPTKEVGLSFSNRAQIGEGDQVYNFYGDKSNSELLVAYGFILPKSSNAEMDKDSINLRIRPTQPASLALRRRQNCHVIPSNVEEEFMYAVQRRAGQTGLPEFALLPHGLLDTILCLFANSREREVLSSDLSYCPGKDPGLYQRSLMRSAVQMLNLLSQKLRLDIARIKQAAAFSENPQANNQRLAVEYRDRQLAVLEAALRPISERLQIFQSTSSFCAHPQHAIINHPNFTSSNHSLNDGELLSLECAFNWLHIHYSELFTSIISLISEDQGEPLPLDWGILIEDWNRTYWIVWIFTIMVIAEGNGRSASPGLQSSHAYVISWLASMMQPKYCILPTFLFERVIMLGNSPHGYSIDDSVVRNSIATSELMADQSEHETINNMLHAISHLPQLHAINPNIASSRTANLEKYRNFASYLVHEETLPLQYTMHNGQALEQLVLCIQKKDK
ncbi:hypothetical protein B0O99DRAFT_684327 [Bisporella sp. PMI_857]|nr:hypothetical protein B0O99DRAFT_684327 [Bisporella sp. PMI_857]